jgi:hypothetical protein
LVYDKGISKVEAISNLSVPQNNKIILAQKLQIVTEKTRMYYTNCHRTNHNVETYRVKKKKNTMFLQFLRLPLNRSKYKNL